MARCPAKAMNSPIQKIQAFVFLYNPGVRSVGLMSTARYERERVAQISSAKAPWNQKTRLCRQWRDTGSCRYGDACTFAHGSEELKVFGAGREDWDHEQWQLHDQNKKVKSILAERAE